MNMLSSSSWSLLEKLLNRLRKYSQHVFDLSRDIWFWRRNKHAAKQILEELFPGIYNQTTLEVNSTKSTRCKIPSLYGISFSLCLGRLCNEESDHLPQRSVSKSLVADSHPSLTWKLRQIFFFSKFFFIIFISKCMIPPPPPKKKNMLNF